jgi:hypothetical protein
MMGLLLPTKAFLSSTTDCRSRSVVAFSIRLFSLLVAMLLTSTAHAHFQLNTNIRIIHFESTSEALYLNIRLPTPLIFAEYASADNSTSDNEEKIIAVPFTTSVLEAGERMHYLDKAEIANRQTEFSRFVADGYRLTYDGEAQVGQVEDLQIFSAEQQTPFTNLKQVSDSFSADWLFQSKQAALVGDTLVDIRIRYPAMKANQEIHLSNTLNSKLPSDTFIANLILSYQGDEQSVTRVVGQLLEPIVLNPSRFNAIKSFISHGFEHITSGLDHVLFVLCLTLSVSTFGGLLWRVTGFTIGHSITLMAGFYGFVPQVGWFIPLVEVLIAASIIWVGVIVIKKSSGSSTILVTILIGLLHGFGFSFLLSDLLSEDSPFLLSSLLSFNVGIELGQLLFVSITFSALYLLHHYQPKMKHYCVQSSAVASIAIAFGMMVQRVPNLWVIGS